MDAFSVIPIVFLSFMGVMAMAILITFCSEERKGAATAGDVEKDVSKGGKMVA